MMEMFMDLLRAGGETLDGLDLGQVYFACLAAASAPTVQGAVTALRQVRTLAAA